MGIRRYKNERKNVITFVGPKSSGKTFLMNCLLRHDPKKKKGNDLLRYATYHLPKREAKVHRVTIPEIFVGSPKRYGSYSKSEENSGSVSPDSRSESLAASPGSKRKQKAKFEQRFFYHMDDFNRFHAANEGQTYRSLETTEGLELCDWDACEAIVLDTQGMSCKQRKREEKKAKEVGAVSNSEEESSSKSSSSNDVPPKKKADEPDEPKDVWDEAYSSFLPPLLYAMSGVIVCVCDHEQKNYREFLRNFLKSAVKKVRNASRPSLVVVLVRKMTEADFLPPSVPPSEQLAHRLCLEKAEKKAKEQAEAKRVDSERNMGTIGGIAVPFATFPPSDGVTLSVEAKLSSGEEIEKKDEAEQLEAKSSSNEEDSGVTTENAVESSETSPKKVSRWAALKGGKSPAGEKFKKVLNRHKSVEEKMQDFVGQKITRALKGVAAFQSGTLDEKTLEDEAKKHEKQQQWAEVIEEFGIYFHSASLHILDQYPGNSFNMSLQFTHKISEIREKILSRVEEMNELKHGFKQRNSVQQDVEYDICLSIWHGLSNFHVLYMLKVLIAWSNLSFPIVMALAAAYVTAHVPTTDAELGPKLVSFRMMRALCADLLSPTGGDPRESLSLRWTAGISAIARYVVKMGDKLRDADYQLLQLELMQWLPCAAVAELDYCVEVDDDQSSVSSGSRAFHYCSQPRALHGPIHRCDISGYAWKGEYITPNWTFDPVEESTSLLGIYRSVVKAPEKLSMSEAMVPEKQRPDKSDERFFEEIAKSGGFDLFKERVSIEYGAPFCVLCFKWLLPDGDLLLQRDRLKDTRVREKKMKHEWRCGLVKESMKELNPAENLATSGESGSASRDTNVIVPNATLKSNTSLKSTSRNATPLEPTTLKGGCSPQTPDPKSSTRLFQSPPMSGKKEHLEDEEVDVLMGAKTSELKRMKFRPDSVLEEPKVIPQNFEKYGTPTKVKQKVRGQGISGKVLTIVEDEEEMSPIMRIGATPNSHLKSCDSPMTLLMRATASTPAKSEGGPYCPLASPDKYRMENDDLFTATYSETLEQTQQRWVHGSGKKQAADVYTKNTLGLTRNTSYMREVWKNEWNVDPTLSKDERIIIAEEMKRGDSSPNKDGSSSRSSSMRGLDTNLQENLTLKDKTMGINMSGKSNATQLQALMHREPEGLYTYIESGIDPVNKQRMQIEKAKREQTFTRDQLEWIRQTFKNTSSRYLRFCKGCFVGYTKHYRMRGVPDPDKYEENWQRQPKRVMEQVLSRPGVELLPKFRPVLNAAETQPKKKHNPFQFELFGGKRYKGENKGQTVRDLVPGGGFEPKLTFQPPVGLPLVTLQDRKNIGEMLAKGGEKEIGQALEDGLENAKEEGEKRNKCPACGVSGKAFAVVHPCFHRFCLDCIMEWREHCNE